MTPAALETVALGRRYGKKWALRNLFADRSGGVGHRPGGSKRSRQVHPLANGGRPFTTESRHREDIRRCRSPEWDSASVQDRILRPVAPALREPAGQGNVDAGAEGERNLGRSRRLRWLGESNIPLDQRVDRLSLGQQALVALALCVGKSPDLLLLDEPVASLDPLARRQLLEMLLASVADRGTTVFLSSHIISELEPVCDHLIILSDSNVRVTGSIEVLLSSHRILVGPRGEALPSNVDVVSTREAERQSTVLVRGKCELVGPSWQVLEPDLEEIVLAYLSTPSTRPSPSGGLPAETWEGQA